ncbi:hypothetical protein M885DRAFT_580964 [Pelagophyceae sp. CCMP2097]|jgi:hypothetical protein|nr:hypothetical protein M885DRAFT_580964 [Pelagophyceae sp. CCMP2097]
MAPSAASQRRRAQFKFDPARPARMSDKTCCDGEARRCGDCEHCFSDAAFDAASNRSLVCAGLKVAPLAALVHQLVASFAYDTLGAGLWTARLAGAAVLAAAGLYIAAAVRKREAAQPS